MKTWSNLSRSKRCAKIDANPLTPRMHYSAYSCGMPTISNVKTGRENTRMNQWKTIFGRNKQREA